MLKSMKDKIEENNQNMAKFEDCNQTVKPAATNDNAKITQGIGSWNN